MVTVINTNPLARRRADECEPIRCPVCGGLECLCRPRFFAGQLLTDEDLNRLDRYIVEKNKLHNRYLHGWGVVCGLEVVCQPCNVVTVRPGYALSQCGEDIVVCAATEVDVCALINRCREKKPQWECEPWGGGRDDAQCRDVYEDWLLAIRYDEKPSRGVMALRGSSWCGCGGSSCGCGGGSSSSSCGCGGKGMASGTRKTASTRTQKANTAQCEPTVICEGYSFEVYKARLPDPERKQDYGLMLTKMLKCFKDFVAALPKEPATSAGKPAWHEYCWNLKESLLDFLVAQPIHDCLLAERIANAACPEPEDVNQTDQDYINLVKQTVSSVIAPVGAEYIRACICSALLPPCSDPVLDPRVPLATITIRKDTCRIVRVCNWNERKFVTTFPNLGYWFSFIPFVRQLRKALAKLCCKPFDLQRSSYYGGSVRVAPDVNSRMANAEGASEGGGTGSTGGAGGASGGGGGGGGDESSEVPLATDAFTNVKGPGLPNNEFFKVFERAWANRAQTVDARTLFIGAIGAKDENGEPVLTEAELNNPFLFLILNQLARPIFAKVPAETPNVLKNAAVFTRATKFDMAEAFAVHAAAAEAPSEEMAQLREQMAELEKTVRQQQVMIDELNKG